MEKARAVLIDCDTGVDDALAILYLAADPQVEILAVGTVDGNVAAELGAENSLRALEVAGLLGVPVAVGARAPLLQESRHAEHFHGQDGLGDSHLPPPRSHPTEEGAVEQMVRLARSRPGEVSLLAIGPLTNLALALGVEPRLPELLREVVIMGGAVACPGNQSPWAEFNIAHDPEAAEIALRARWRRLVLVGLDATGQAILDQSQYERLGGSASADFASRILAQQMRANHRFELCDPLAAALLVDPTLASYQSLPVSVDLEGRHTRGATIADRRVTLAPTQPETRPVVEIAMSVAADRFLGEFCRRLGSIG
jgi:purine nucleosidase